MTNVELKYNPYTSTTLIQINGKNLNDDEITEYVGAGDNVSDWARNFWERISTKCNDDFVVHFCGLESDYLKIEQAFHAFKEHTTDDVFLEPDYVINPALINDEKYVKDELDIIFGKKCIDRTANKECSECKNIISEKSVYCPICGKKQDGTERIDESRLFIEKYLKEKKADNTIKEKFNGIYELLKKLYLIENNSNQITSKDSVPSLPNLELFEELFTIYVSKPGYDVVFADKHWKVVYNHHDEALLISLRDDQTFVFEKLGYTYFNSFKRSADIVNKLKKEVNNSLHTDYLKAIFSDEEKKYLKEHNQNKIFIPTTNELPNEILDYLSIGEGNPLLEDAWISKKGNPVPYIDSGWSPHSFFVYAIIVDTSCIMNLFKNK